MDSFFSQVKDNARKLDRGEAVEAGFHVSFFFEDPADFLEVITRARCGCCGKSRGKRHGNRTRGGREAARFDDPSKHVIASKRSTVLSFVIWDSVFIISMTLTVLGIVYRVLRSIYMLESAKRSRLNGLFMAWVFGCGAAASAAAASIYEFEGWLVLMSCGVGLVSIGFAVNLTESTSMSQP